MELMDFIKERILFIIISLSILIFSSILLAALRVDSYAIFFIFILNFIGVSIFHVYDYFNKRKYYNELISNLDRLDKKYLISEVADEGNFLDSKILYYVIKEATKAMNDEIASLKINNNEYREYIELWVHEVKTPISSCKLLIENNKSEITKSIDEEIDKVENYIEQALFYTRSNALEKDYIIKELNLKNSINKVIKRNANTLIERRIKVEVKDLEEIVYSDSKWIEFIINQIISNSIKYMGKGEGTIKFYTNNIGENIILNIEDTATGMNEKDVIKAFEKGYTGEKGRKFGKSTGIGLYLCKKLAIKLGLGISLTSEINVGTKVSIIFPINRMMTFEK
ncbi:sensor histidine kinase [Clostridium algidicarnis]|uniref:sensor histidine kinase n=1 Tax=Clostridium algidicarnis TaxID=37659 RepID=UPI001C0E8044|nr:sensor histidine kinase [Clostridium algidicarnis]MBU3203902.1 sensor histidine kinase [Clostridium algidicarnis]MBU3207483.1 sensor histidine kinase [Clostridium algidicarnis]MBU3212056.1 sensor histidine kinase [Clostridium algidicarnis]MBU3221438.1 sensor histidine kinase [Clostridium algidicarnis]